MMSRQRKGKENEAVHGVGTFGKIVSYVVMILVCFISLFPVISILLPPTLENFIEKEAAP